MVPSKNEEELKISGEVVRNIKESEKTGQKGEELQLLH